jgi:phosphoglycolate phosphatase-like HAD superfamily hydrolase
MTKALVFDMDGTIADFYGVYGWDKDLKNNDVRPYVEAKPLVNMEVLNILLDAFRARGWKIIVTTWLAKNSSRDYDDKVRAAKKAWLARYGFTFDEFHGVKYGPTKANCTRRHGGFQVLIDDNEAVRRGWHLGAVVNANENIVEKLIDLLEMEV